MKLNIFEGARRITKIIAVMWVIGWAYNLATWSPSPHNGFHIPHKGFDIATAKLLYPDPSPEGLLAEQRSIAQQRLIAKERLKDSTPDLTKLSNADLLALEKVGLAAVSYEGLIAMYQANEVMKTAVKEYINDSAAKDWSARWEKIKFNSLWAFGGLAFLFIFSWSIGWIVRGFAGIPSGQDKKPDDI